MTKYRPRCPSSDCSGGLPPRKATDAEQAHLTPEVLERRREGDATFRCPHCGFVWFQKSSDPIGFDPIPAGLYDSMVAHNRFVPVPINFGIRPDHKPSYSEAKRAQEHLRRRRGNRKR